jgi:hypothetical protein
MSRGLRETPVEDRSRDPEVLRGRLAAIADEFELNHLSLIQGAEPSALNRRDVDEYVLVAIRWMNKPVALGRVEPFDGALLHRLSPKSIYDVAAKGGTHRCEPRYKPGFVKIRYDCVHNAQRPEPVKIRLRLNEAIRMRLKQGF